MHELAIAQSICDHALKEAQRHGATRVISVTCRVGVMRQLVPGLMEAAFTLSAEGTPLEDATLVLETQAAEVTCAACGSTTLVHAVPLECPSCGSGEIRCSGGQDITLVSLEVNEEVCDEDPNTPAA